LIFVENPVDWSVDDVYYWAIGKVGVDEEIASVLKSRNVNGKLLWTLTEDDLKQTIPNFAKQLSISIKTLRNEWAKRIACMRNTQTNTHLSHNI
jgi:hypothetical protein